MEDFDLQWDKLTIKASNELQAPIENILLDLDAQGIEKDDTEFLSNQDKQINISGFFELQQEISNKLDLIKKKLLELEKYGFNTQGIELVSQIIDDETWKNEWEKYYHVQRITNFLTIVPFWEEYRKTKDSEIVINLDPQQAFGTGTHPTTILTLQALESHLRGNERVFDVGTGTGVLSIAASLLGAKEIYACDIEDDSLISAKRNLELNKKVTNVELELSSLLDKAKGKADLILANVLPEVQAMLLPQVEAHLNNNGMIIMSGIILEKEAAMRSLIKENGLEIMETLSDGKWIAITAKKTQEG
ncbi:ribosomal protein L11 methyltransferase [Liquorilactobacillus cacaonum DSM 21116]|uniref:Ribosomal protein L11 methyltransferase n=1 Tax=Liquorilactobacillus cacaonum DSM 21116 TaxID=1423729 RepID=A0A0R2CTR2_9LACO|nr:ribosomal protein L11 methyltransferase [Liquorilactobacillus cacaonum DSM 21116]